MQAIDNFNNLSLQNTYSSLEVNLVDDVAVPLLKCAIKYDRGVGFFTSNWLKEAAKGLIFFVKNQGKARVITSPRLTEKDWEAIKLATIDKQSELIVRTSIENLVEELEAKLEWDTLAALAWLIRDGILEFRFAIPKENLNGGIFHSKLALFLDSQGNGVALHGSQNDSSHASLNEETLSVFCSWDVGARWYNEYRMRFEKMWGNKFRNLQILKVLEAEKNIIIRHTENLPRPYSFIPPESISANSTYKNKPHMPSDIVLHDYQTKAIEAWERQKRLGIFEMATGTGKTITSICAAVKLFKSEGRLALVILAPFIHLVDQWKKDLQTFGFQPIPCYQNRKSWWNLVKKSILEFNADLSHHLCLITTHSTASSPDFARILSRLNPPWLMIGDEIHGLGAPKFQNGLIESASWRIGLSATPNRWYDAQGTQVLRHYFGETVISYDLKTAIEEKFLTPYRYYPILIDLEGEEIEEYLRLSTLIAQTYSINHEETEYLESLLRKRANLIGSASRKIPKLVELVGEHRGQCEERGERFQHALFYCNKGTHREVLEAISKLGIRTHEFVHDVPLNQRSEILQAFAHGEIEALVAIRCLDEGVDVPATRRAYILASSTNPREFVQRRGRILRKASEKHFALVYDFLVGPWNTMRELGEASSKALLLRELPRFAEFSQDSQNYYEASEGRVWPIAMRLGLTTYLRKRPWEVYQELHQNRLIENYD